MAARSVPTSRSHRSRAAAPTGAAVIGLITGLIAALLAGPVSAPAQAAAQPADQPACVVVESSPVVWHTAPDRGGFVLTLALQNQCDAPVAGWELALGLAPGHTASHGWNAQWTLGGDPLLATSPPWQPSLAPNAPFRIGLIGTWSGAYTDPVSCVVNGSACDGSRPNQPPQVSLTSPADGATVLFPGSVTFAAEASDPDGSVARVAFYLDGELVATDDAAPYQAQVPLGIPFCTCTAYARAVDDGDPALSTDSDPVDFFLVSVPPAPYTVSPTSLAVPEGGSASFRVELTAPTTVSFQIRVVGDPGLTAAPAAFGLDQNTLGQDVTVTAAPGTAPASAVVWVDTFPNATAVPVTVVGAGSP